MKKFWFLFLLFIAANSWAGDTTTNGYFYLPSLGASGSSERTSFYNSLQATDAVIKLNSNIRTTDDCPSGYFMNGVDSDGNKLCGLPTSAVSGGWTDAGIIMHQTDLTDSVGIGTSEPGSILDVNGPTRVGTSLFEHTDVNTGLSWADGDDQLDVYVGGIKFIDLSEATVDRTQITNSIFGLSSTDVSCTDSGDSNPAAVTILPDNESIYRITGQADSDGCNITIDETNAQAGDILIITTNTSFVGPNPVVLNLNGVVNLGENVTLSPNETLALVRNNSGNYEKIGGDTFIGGITAVSTEGLDGVVNIDADDKDDTADRWTLTSSASTNDLYFTNSSSNLVTFQDGGNVGIGTTAPSTKLHVVGGARITGLVSCDTIDTDVNGVLSCGTDTGSGGSTTWDNIGDAGGNGSVGFANTSQDITSTLDGGGGYVLQISDTDADAASDTTLLKLSHNDGGDANVIYLDTINDADGTPTSIFKVTQTAITSTVAVTVPTEAYDATGWNGNLTVPTKDAVRDKIETISAGTGDMTSVGDCTTGAAFGGSCGTAISFSAGAILAADSTHVTVNKPITISTGGSSALGVGTTAPTKELHVVGNARITGLVSCDTIDTDSSGNLACGTDGGGSGSGTGDVTGVGNCATGACFSGAASTGDQITSTTLDVLNMSNNGELRYVLDTDTTVSIMGQDSSGATNTVFDTFGAGTVRLGSSDVTSASVVTDGGTVTIDGSVQAGTNKGFILTSTGQGLKGAGDIFFDPSGTGGTAMAELRADNSNLWFGNDSGDSFVGTNSDANTFFGQNAGDDISTGFNNTGMGQRALFVATSANYNTALGKSTLEKCTTCDRNVAVGKGPLQNLTDGSRNVVVGVDAASDLTTEDDNIVMGYHAIQVATGVNNSIIIGSNAVTTALTSMDKSIYIGSFAVGVDSLSYNGCLGYGCTSAQSNSFTLGGTTSTTYMRLGVGTSAPEATIEAQGYEGADATLALDADDGDDTTDTWFIKSDATNNDLTFSNDTSALITFKNSGKVGIGNSAPSVLLSLGNTTSTTTANSGLKINGQSGGCLILQDTDHAGFTECCALNGTLTCGIDADGLPDGTP